MLKDKHLNCSRTSDPQVKNIDQVGLNSSAHARTRNFHACVQFSI